MRIPWRDRGGRVRNLVVYAGARARRIVEESGLRPDTVEVVAGAAGGPKWLVLDGLDEAIFSSWITKRTRPLFLVGSSVGAWRFAALAQGIDAHRRFREAYLAQRFTTVPTASQASAEIGKFLDAALADGGPSRALSHPHNRLNVLTVACRGPYALEHKHVLLVLMAAAGILNVFSRRLLGLFFTRVLFHDPRDLPPFHRLSGFGMRTVPLSEANLADSVMASGSMPVIMRGVRDIDGAGPGMYRDAGILDYHLAFDFGCTGIVLYPHYTRRITPGWFDKPLPWRKPSSRALSSVLVVCPSESFVASLPLGRIPSREDFRLFWGRDDERAAYWKAVVDAGRVLGDEFLEALAKDTLARHIRPIESIARP